MSLLKTVLFLRKERSLSTQLFKIQLFLTINSQLSDRCWQAVLPHLRIQNYKQKRSKRCSQHAGTAGSREVSQWCTHYSASQCAQSLGILRQELYQPLRVQITVHTQRKQNKNWSVTNSASSKNAQFLTCSNFGHSPKIFPWNLLGAVATV